MDFLIAFEQAKTLGLTKEEFMNVWESESKLKMAVNAGDMNSSISGYADIKQSCQNKIVDGHGSSVDAAFNKLETRPEAKQDNHFVPEYLYKQLIDKYDQLWQQVNQKYDQLLREFHSHFEILSNQISNVGDAQANSLKLYFMHEIDLLKQDLRRSIEEQNTRPETDMMQSVMSKQQSVMSKQQSVMSRQQAGIVRLPDLSVHQDVISQSSSSSSCQRSSHSQDQENKNKPKYNYLQQNTEGFQFQQGDLAQPDCNHHLAGDKGVRAVIDTYQKGPSRPQNSFADILKSIPVKANAGGIPASARLQDSSGAEAVLNLNKGSVAATGLFANTIASQMKQKQSSQASSVKSGTSSMKSDPATIKTGKKKAKASISITSSAINSKHEFTVDALTHFIVSKKPIMSPYVYSSGKRCKARLVVNVKDISFLLTIHVHVSKGEFDDSHKWPLTLKGSGYVFNPGSRRFTPLWQLESVICDKPTTSGEVIFPAVVCLMTSKRNLKDVTLNELMLRYKVGEENLTFLWDLKATEKQLVAEK